MAPASAPPLLLMLVLLLLTSLSTRSIDLGSEIRPEDIALVQYDSRAMDDYWLASAQWNKHYCDRHRHQFIYYSTVKQCQYDKDNPLASPWCKVKAMVQANEDYPDVKVFVYMDSDAVVDMRFKDQPVGTLLKTMQTKMLWDPEAKPMVFNQDGPCWWCGLIKRVGYDKCLNAGTVLWYRHRESEAVLNAWWHAAMDPYATNPIKRKFRIKWPWEQDRQMALFNRTPEHIQIAPDPGRSEMKNNYGWSNWCLSHLPGHGCFISHHCAHKGSKAQLIQLYKVPEGYFPRCVERKGACCVLGCPSSRSSCSFPPAHPPNPIPPTSVACRSYANATHPFGFKIDTLRL